MGTTYAHVVVKGVGQKELTDWLTTRGIDAVVTPPVNGVCLVAERGAAFSACCLVAGEASGRFDVPTVAIGVLDEDVLSYRLYAGGSAVDEYESDPDYHDFEGEHIPPRGPMGGDAGRLARAFDSPSLDELERVLRRELLFEDECDRHRRIAALLGWPDFVSPFDYERADILRRYGEDRPIARSGSS